MNIPSSEAIHILADAVIATYIAKHRRPDCSPTPKQGELALPVRREEAFMSVPRSEPR